jgi:hypothetical protein
MVDIAKIETEAEQVGADVLADAKSARGWLKSAWAWARGTSWKTKAVVGVIVALGLLLGIASRAPSYVTASEANRMLTEHDSVLRSEIKTLSQHADTLDAGLHQLDSRVKALEAKPEPAPITTGSIPKKKVSVKKHARKPASSWFDLP